MATLTLTQNTRTAVTLRNNGDIIVSGGLIVENPVGWVGTRRAATVSMRSTLVGDVLTINARVRANAEITNLTLRGLTFVFGAQELVGPPPVFPAPDLRPDNNPYRGQLVPRHPTAFTELLANPDVSFHPSYREPTAGTWSATNNIGYGIFLPSHIDRPKLYAFSANQQLAQRSPELTIHTTQTLQAGASADFVLSIRVADSSMPNHTVLLQEYRTAIQAYLGARKYAATLAPVMQFTYADAVSVRANNPLGYNDGNVLTGGRRFDTPESVTGATSWPTTRFPSITSVGGAGAMMWIFGGHDPRKTYRAENVFPAAVQPQWLPFIAAATAAGLKVGLCARPAEVLYDRSSVYDVTNVTRTDPSFYGIQSALYLDAKDPAHIKICTDRFRASHADGVRMYYLDSFGFRGSDLPFLKAIRAVVGYDVPMWCEFGYDLMYSDAGRWIEVNNSAADPEKKHGFSITVTQLATLRWAYPNTEFLSHSPNGSSTLTERLNMDFAVLMHDFNLTGPGNQVDEINDWRNSTSNDWLPD